MCGIAGIVWSDHRSHDAGPIVDRMIGSIYHRGPDSAGRFSTNFAEVGFRRLSIIDLAGGDQPLSNEDGSVQCFLNGEIYNYRDLRKDLEAKGHQFRTRSDAEVLPHLYEEYGTNLFRHLNGMFIVCLIDVGERQVVLARDQFGVKQLYFASTSGGTVFASELKAVLASGLVEPELDQSNVLSFLTLFYCPEPATLVRGVKKLEPGSWMKLQPGQPAQIQKFYEIPTTPVYDGRDLDGAAQRTRELLWQSVSLQLHADVPVGISLSGGIDSSALACAAVYHQQPGADPLALTIHWPDTAPDELASARELCHHLELRHQVLEIPVTNLLEELPLLGWMSDEPVADPAMYSQFCIAREASKHVKVLLSGAGGDELFGGYGSYVLARRYKAFIALPAVIQNGLRALLRRLPGGSSALDALVEYDRSRCAWHSYTKSNATPLDQSLIGRHIPNSRDPFANFRSLYEQYKQYDPANQQMIVDFHTYLPEQILTMTDRATMAASIEGRVPFLDPAIVDFAFSLPGSVKIGNNSDFKRVLKRAISKDVSGSVLKRKKAGMPSPFVSFLTRHVGALRRILFCRDSYVQTILPMDWLRDITATPEIASASFRVLYPILVLEIWHKLFIREGIHSRPEVGARDLFEIPTPALTV